MIESVRTSSACPREFVRVVHDTLGALHPRALVPDALPDVCRGVRELAVLSIGKGSVPLAREALRVISRAGEASTVRGLVVTLEEHADEAAPLEGAGFEIVVSDHPTPTVRSVQAAGVVEAWADRVTADDAVLALVTGGGSAQLASPIDGVRLDDVARVASRVMLAGGTIEQLNRVRKGLDRLKGGGLARRLPEGVPGVAWVISDVLGDDPATVSSGPLVAVKGDRAEDALAMLDELGLEDLSSVFGGRIRAAWPPGDARGGGVEIPHRVIGNNATAVAAAARFLEARGRRVVETRGGVEGEARSVGRAMGDAVRALPSGSAVVWGGETTVRVGDAAGVGGPCLEVALGAAEAMSGLGPGCRVLAFATDGRDGPTDAAGAWSDGTTAGGDRGDEIAAALERHSALDVCDRLGLTIRTGRTGTNVNDVIVGVRD